VLFGIGLAMMLVTDGLLGRVLGRFAGPARNQAAHKA